MSTGEEESVQDFHDGDGFFNIALGPLIAQIEEWHAGRGEFFAESTFHSAKASAEAALTELDTLPVDAEDLRRYLLHVCVSRGYAFHYLPHADPVLGTRMRARIDSRLKQIEVFQPAVLELSNKLPKAMRPKALCLVLAHELFHSLRPHCHHPELSAHLFAAAVCRSPLFPGLLDL